MVFLVFLLLPNTVFLLFIIIINFCLYIFVICLLRQGPPRLAFASCGHALSVNRPRKIKEKVQSVKCEVLTTCSSSTTK